MQPLADWPAPQRRAIHGVFTDIDDTLTTHGEITSSTLQALADLRAAGLRVLAITGRPLGWAEARVQSWPVDAVVAENGAMALVPPGPLQEKITGLPNLDLAGALQILYRHDTSTRARDFARLQEVAQQVLHEVPGVGLARDVGRRETDIAFDHAEFAALAPEQIDAMEAVMRRAGLYTTRSSIHTHGSVQPSNKWNGAVWAVKELLGCDLLTELGHWVAVGDSGNDEPMFEHFRHSVGVANIQRVATVLRHLPRYITPSERGAGFEELARALLSARADT